MRRTLVKAFKIIFMTATLLGPSPIPALAASCCLCQVQGKGICLTSPPQGNCATIPSSNADLKDVTCTDLADPQCVPVAKNGRCTEGPVETNLFKLPKAETPGSGFKVKITSPELNVPIPGLTFGKDREVELKAGGKVSIPFLAQYIAAVYKYLVGISVIVAAVMIVYGGFKYVAGATIPAIGEGKEIIKDALIGLALLFGCVTILDTVNTNIVRGLTPIEIEAVRQDPHKFRVSPADYKAILTSPGGELNFNTGECSFALGSNGFPTAESVYTCSIKLARENNIDPCYAVVALNRESDGLPTALGKEENYYASDRPIVPSRAAFIRFGVKYSGATFEVPGFPSDCNKQTGPTCRALLQKHRNIVNDDVLDTTKDDLGLDWRFGKSLGPKQITISGTLQKEKGVGKGSNWCGNGPSYMFEGKCLTPKQVFHPMTSIKLGISLLKGAGAARGTSPEVAMDVWASYVGSKNSGVPDAEVKRRTDLLQNCVQGGDPIKARSSASIGWDKSNQ